eukprot:COSAG01_NODE_9979_length_2285_cov_1.987649_4_plen_151_part_00
MPVGAATYLYLYTAWISAWVARAVPVFPGADLLPRGGALYAGSWDPANGSVRVVARLGLLAVLVPAVLVGPAAGRDLLAACCFESCCRLPPACCCLLAAGCWLLVLASGMAGMAGALCVLYRSNILPLAPGAGCLQLLLAGAWWPYGLEK